MKVTSKGQVTIPLPVREALGIRPHSEVDFVVDGDCARLEVRSRRGRGRQLTERMKGRARGRLSTEDIMKLTRGEP